MFVQRLRPRRNSVTDIDILDITWNVDERFWNNDPNYVDTHTDVPTTYRDEQFKTRYGEHTVGPDFQDEDGGELGAFKEVTNSKCTINFQVDSAGFEPRSYNLAGINPNGPGDTYVCRTFPIWKILESVPAFSLASYDPRFFDVVLHGGIPPLLSVEKLLEVFHHSSLSHDVKLNVDIFDTNFSLWFLIVDLLDIKKLAKTLFSANSNLARLSTLGHRQSDQTAKQLADDHLAVQFGLIPTIADIQAFHSILLRWKRVYDANNDVLHKRYTWRSRSGNLKEQVPIDSSGDFPVVIDNAFPCILHYEDHHELRHARSMQYFFTCPEFQGWFSRMRQFIDSFGVLDPSALWDVIPFSFVVDWIYHIGNWLHRNRPILFPAEAWITYYMESIRLSSTRTWYMTWNDPIFGQSFPLGVSPWTVSKDKVITFSSSTYLRRRFLPPQIETTPRLPSPGSLLSLKRIAISASLANQRLVRTKRSRERTRW